MDNFEIVENLSEKDILEMYDDDLEEYLYLSGCVVGGRYSHLIDFFNRHPDLCYGRWTLGWCVCGNGYLHDYCTNSRDAALEQTYCTYSICGGSLSSCSMNWR